MADNVAITAGSGTSVATDDVGGVQYQRVKTTFGTDGVATDVSAANPLPVSESEFSTYVVSTQNIANVAAARTTHLDLFNAVGSGVVVTVRALFSLPSLVAVTGVGLTWEVIRTSAVGTGGTALTAGLFNSANPALPAQVTARSKPTGGATLAATLLFLNTSSEETLPYANMASNLNLLPVYPDTQGLVLHEGEGLRVDQTTSSSVGTTNTVFVFTF